MIIRTLLSWGLLCLSLVATANPKTEFKQKFYDVTGATPAEIRQSLNRNSPVRGQNKQRFDAETQWRVFWQYRWQQDAQGCRINQVDVTLKLAVTLPKWQAPSQAATATRHRWTHYINALNQHEQRHQQYGKRAALAVEEALWQMGYFDNCQALSKAANAEAQALIDLFAQLDKRFDLRTRNGGTQGVHLR